MTNIDFHRLGPQAQDMAKNCNNEKLALVFQYVAIGSMIVMGFAGLAHIVKDIGGSWRKEPAEPHHRQLKDDVDRHARHTDRYR